MNQKSQEHFIRNVNIKNYKCFEDFNADGFERVNLVGGMNNIGKTALLESLFINSRSKDVKNFLTSLQTINFIRYQIDIFFNSLRGKFDYIGDWRKSVEQLSKFSVITNINGIKFSSKEVGLSKKYFVELDSENLAFLLNDITHESIEYISNIVFLDQHGEFRENIKESFAEIQRKNKEEWLNSQLKYFEKDVDAFKFIGDAPSCHKISIDKYLDIHEFGDGLKSFISILCDLHKCQDGYLFIDEVDNGIHYSKFDQLWEIILTVSKETNTQVFATTHSKECIDSFNRAQKKFEKEDNKSAYFELARTPNNKIVMLKLDIEQLEYELTHKGRFRGE